MAPEQVTKPARRYVAKALPLASGGYLAQYAFPGVTPRYVTAEHVEPGQGKTSTARIFDHAEDAEDAARFALFEALNNRPSENTKRERYRLLSGPEFADAVRACGITPTFFCYLWGTNTERFFQWVDETPDKSGRVVSPPHGVRLLLETWRAIPESIDLAESITEQVTTERKPRRHDE
jgi:hypothetical protein